MTQPRELEHFWAVVPAGGAGTRLWPLSRQGEPKFLRDLRGSGRSLLQETRDRLAPLVGDRFMVVTGVAHRAAVRTQLPEVDDAWVLAEPSPRDSMAAIGLAAAVLEREDPDAVMGSFAADHVIVDDEGFADAVATAVDVAREGWLVTLGIEPTFPSSAFGYVKEGDALDAHPAARLVESFVEKPSEEVAAQYLAAGGYRWNAGMFVVRPSTLLDLLARWHPGFAADLRAIAADRSLLDATWGHLPRIAVDHAIAEPAAELGHVATVPAGFDWDDVGDFDSLAGLLGDPGDGPAVLGDAALVHAIDTSGLVVTGQRMVALLGLDDVVVVDTPDALLVASRSRAQDVKAIVTALKAERPELT